VTMRWAISAIWLKKKSGCACDRTAVALRQGSHSRPSGRGSRVPRNLPRTMVGAITAVTSGLDSWCGRILLLGLPVACISGRACQSLLRSAGRSPEAAATAESTGQSSSDLRGRSHAKSRSTAGWASGGDTSIRSKSTRCRRFADKCVSGTVQSPLSP